MTEWLSEAVSTFGKPATVHDTEAVFTYWSEAPAGIAAVAVVVSLAPEASVTVLFTLSAASVTVQLRSGVSAEEVLFRVRV